jgi:hypothetical protein
MITEKLFGLGEIHPFAILAEAKQAFRESHHDLVICDGSLQESDDGLAWAKELQKLGQPVIPCSFGDNNFIDCKIDKRYFNGEELKDLARQKL